MGFFASLINSMPSAVAQGLIWGIMAIGVYLTYRILDVADLTVDGSLGTGGAVCVVMVLNGAPVGLALLAATAAGTLAGGLLAQYQGFSDINMGRGAIVIGLAAVIIGEVIFSRIFRNFALKLLSAVIGAIIYYIVMVFVLRLGLSTDDLKLLTALVVALFLTIPYWKGKYFTKTSVKKGEKNHA